MRRPLNLVKSARGIFEPAMREEDVLGQIRSMLEVNGARVYRAIERVPKCYRCGCWLGSSEPGTPDLSGYFRKDIGNGLSAFSPFWFEVKRPKGGRKRAAQVERIDQIRGDGGCAAIVRSWDEVKEELKRHWIPLAVE